MSERSATCYKKYHRNLRNYKYFIQKTSWKFKKISLFYYEKKYRKNRTEIPSFFSEINNLLIVSTLILRELQWLEKVSTCCIITYSTVTFHVSFIYHISYIISYINPLMCDLIEINYYHYLFKLWSSRRVKLRLVWSQRINVVIERIIIFNIYIL